jgi:MFS family permease
MALFASANLSYMFFLLKASRTFSGNLSIEIPLLMYALFNLSYTALSLPAGALSDRIGRRRVLLSGYLLFVPVTLGFTRVSSLVAFVFLFLVLGVVYALVEGNQRAFAADLAAREERGLALGAFHLGIGLAALTGNTLAGLLWSYLAPEAAFIYGAATALLAALLLLASSSILSGDPRP